jgi:hypothetical protein
VSLKSHFGLGGLFGSHVGLTSVSLGLTLVIKTVSFGSLLGLAQGARDQNKTKKDPNETVETAIRPKRDSFETKRRPICD